MNKLAILLLFLIVIAASPPPAQSPYAGQENRQIKSLDAGTITALQNGEGHAMALAAELNHYPGPRHVLSMAADLGLSAEQKAATQAVYDRMHAAAVPLGLEIIRKEQNLDLAFRNGSISDTELAAFTEEVAALNGRLRFVHLNAHLAMRRILTPSQIQMYDSMRGYGQSMPEMEH